MKDFIKTYRAAILAAFATVGTILALILGADPDKTSDDFEEFGGNLIELIESGEQVYEEPDVFYLEDVDSTTD